jgi:sulfite exporter TauE/SafE
MIDLRDVSTPAAAFAAGLVTSLHCAAMCGPLACALKPRPAAYHLSRTLGYGIAGLLLGAAGYPVLALLESPAGKVIPWVMVAVFALLGFGLDRYLPKPRLPVAWFGKLPLRSALGWVTPLLPCGPLWLMYGAAVFTGSPLASAVLMLAFGAGTIPLYALAQAGFIAGGRFLSPSALRWTQRAFALAAAGLLAWRASLPGDACCH